MSDLKVGEIFLSVPRDVEVIEREVSADGARPILFAFLLTVFDKFRQHDDDRCFFLPYHVPKVFDGGAPGTLRGDEDFFARKPVNVTGVYVIGHVIYGRFRRVHVGPIDVFTIFLDV